MRIYELLLLCIEVLDSLDCVLVGYPGSLYHLAHLLIIIVENISKPLEVARVAYVHGVGVGLEAWVRFVLARLQVQRYLVVQVCGCNELLHWHSPAPVQYACGKVSEVAAWHAEYNVLVLCLELVEGIHIVERLREKASQVD